MTSAIYKERARMAFDRADEGFTRSLNKRQYKVAMTAVFGYCPDKAEVKHVFQSTDTITYGEFECWVLRKGVENNSHVNANMLFALLDKDYKGYLIFDDFYFAGEAADLKVSLPVWRMIFNELDHCKKGYIDFDEFLHIV